VGEGYNGFFRVGKADIDTEKTFFLDIKTE
jgi:hypothetical protein